MQVLMIARQGVRLLIVLPIGLQLSGKFEENNGAEPARDLPCLVA
jgi:hypothetical protein